jgi:hypothetical protein
MTIETATTISSENGNKSNKIRREDVLRAYSGKTGCMCGCKGSYYCPASTPVEKRESAKVSEAQVTRIVEAMNLQAERVFLNERPSLDQEPILFLENGTRTMVLYLRPGADVSGFEVES